MPDFSSASVGLTGMGAAPVVSLSASALTFSAQPLLSPSPSQPVMLTNSGDGNLNLGSIAAGGDFSQANNCGNSLAPGASCAVSVTFAPTAIGARTGTLVFTDSAAGSPQSVSLNGTGADFAISASPTTPSVDRGSSVRVTVTLSPSGGSFAKPVALSCSGLPAQSACAFNPINPVPGNSGATSVMTVTTNRSYTPTGTFVITIIGQSGSLQHSSQISLTIRKH